MSSSLSNFSATDDFETLTQPSNFSTSDDFNILTPPSTEDDKVRSIMDDFENNTFVDDGFDADDFKYTGFGAKPGSHSVMHQTAYPPPPLHPVGSVPPPPITTMPPTPPDPLNIHNPYVYSTDRNINSSHSHSTDRFPPNYCDIFTGGGAFPYIKSSPLAGPQALNRHPAYFSPHYPFPGTTPHEQNHLAQLYRQHLGLTNPANNINPAPHTQPFTAPLSPTHNSGIGERHEPLAMHSSVKGNVLKASGDNLFPAKGFEGPLWASGFKKTHISSANSVADSCSGKSETQAAEDDGWSAGPSRCGMPWACDCDVENCAEHPKRSTKLATSPKLNWVGISGMNEFGGTPSNVSLTRSHRPVSDDEWGQASISDPEWGNGWSSNPRGNVTSPIPSRPRPGWSNNSLYSGSGSSPASAKTPERVLTGLSAEEYLAHVNDPKVRIAGLEDQMRKLDAMVKELTSGNIKTACAHCQQPQDPSNHNCPLPAMEAQDPVAVKYKIEMLRQRITSSNMFSYERNLALQILNSIKGTNISPVSPTPNPWFRAWDGKPLPDAPKATSDKTESTSALSRMEMQMMDMSKDITKLKAFNKFERMQQDSDRLARIEAQLAPTSSAQENQDKPTMNNLALRIDELAAKIDEHKAKFNNVDDWGRRIEDENVANMQAICSGITRLQSQVGDNSAKIVNEFGVRDEHLRDLQTRMERMELDKHRREFSDFMQCPSHSFGTADDASESSGSSWGVGSDSTWEAMFGDDKGDNVREWPEDVF